MTPVVIDYASVSVEEDSITVNGHRYEIRMVRGKMYLNGVQRSALIDHDERTITICDEGSPHRLAWTACRLTAELLSRVAA